MTILFETLTGLALSGLVLAACLAGGPGSPVGSGGREVAVVLDETVRRDPEVLDAARDVVARAERVSPGRVRLVRPRTPTEQLSVTRYLALQNTVLVGVGLDREVAVEPVLRRFPSFRLELVAPDPGRVRSSLEAAVHEALEPPS